MSRKVFISFRFSDGNVYKKKLEEIFKKDNDVIDCSEDEDRSNMSESTIQKYLYNKLRGTSVTIVLLTPNAVNHKVLSSGIYSFYNYNNNIVKYDDWMYDEIKYSLDYRENNKCNGLIAVYTPEAENMVIEKSVTSETTIIKEFNNLIRKNMFNIKPIYKHNPKDGIYDSNTDHYCSLIPWNQFINNYNYYIEMAEKKRENKDIYNIKKRMDN